MVIRVRILGTVSYMFTCGNAEVLFERVLYNMTFVTIEFPDE